jgi:hypothetical protein
MPSEKGMSASETNHLLKTTGELRKLSTSDFQRMKEEHDKSERGKSYSDIRDKAYASMLRKQAWKQLPYSKRPTEWELIQEGIAKRRRELEDSTPTSLEKKAVAEKKRKLALSQSVQTRNSQGGKVMIYTGPKNGKYIIKNGSKVYIDRKSLTNNFQYKKGAKPKKR